MKAASWIGGCTGGNAICEVLTAAGLLIGALALVGTVAVIVSRCAGRRSWPYGVAALLVVCALVWVGPEGFTRNLDAHFEWNSADGFNVFRLQAWDEAAGTWHPAEVRRCNQSLK
jgi:hypothetical protein